MEKDEERIIRQTLWMSHGCTGMYGDDGEMQCATIHGKFGFLDFKRDPIDRLIKGSFHNLLSALEAAQKEVANRAHFESEYRKQIEAAQKEAEGLREAMRKVSRACSVLSGKNGLSYRTCIVCGGAVVHDKNPAWEGYFSEDEYKHKPDCYVGNALARTEKEGI